MHDCTSLRSENGLLLKRQHNCPSWSSVSLQVLLHLQRFLLSVSPLQEHTDPVLVHFQNLKKDFPWDVLRKMANIGGIPKFGPPSENLSLIPSAVLRRTPQSNRIALSSNGKRPPDLNSHTRKSFLARKICQGNVLGSLYLILKLTGEWERLRFMLILVEDEKGLFPFSLLPNVKALPLCLSIRKGTILHPHSTCVQRKPLLKGLTFIPLIFAFLQHE